MISFLFWNINKKNLSEQIRAIALNYNITILALAECDISPKDLLSSLNIDNDHDYFYNHNIGCDKIDIYTGFPNKYLSIKEEDNRTTIRQLSLPGLTDILITITHSPSKNFYSDIDQGFVSQDLASLIMKAEEKVGHKRTVLFGDINMNPFEVGVVASHGLHAVVSKEIAKKGKRVVNGKEYDFFYNPMWNLFGDSRDGPPGTFYYNKSSPINYFWNIFDQVLIRPELIDHFSINDLKILSSYGNDVRLIDEKGIPNSYKFSDHLPLFFSLDI